MPTLKQLQAQKLASDSAKGKTAAQVLNPTVDMVNHPAHYIGGGIECIDAIEAMLSTEEFHGFLKGQVVKYTWRSNHKGNAIEDCRKAQWYQNRLVLSMEKHA